MPQESSGNTRGPLDPDAADFLERFGDLLAPPSEIFNDPAASDRYLAEERGRLGVAGGASLLDESELAVITQDHDLHDGVWVRSYEPVGKAASPRPIALFIHGGGWVTGTIELHDSTCRILAAAGDMVVINVGYRLAPEHPYPGPLDDCDRALQWARSVAATFFGADASRLAVIGASSGGNLAAALALRSRDRGIPEIALQVLMYPALDSLMATESYSPEVNGRDYFISAEHMRWYWDSYRRGSDVRDDDPYFSPLAASDLSGLPPAIIVSAEFDLLRDDALRYEQRLRDAGVGCERQHFPQIHGFLAMFDSIAAAYPEVKRLGARARARLDEIAEAGTAATGRPPAIDVVARVEPGTLSSLDHLVRWDTTNIDSIRATYAAIPRTPYPISGGVTRSDAVIAGEHGVHVPVRWYRPAGISEPLPTVLYIHGGAFIMGTLDENDERLDEFVLETGCAVVSVDYRLAPEHPYPAGLDDVETVWREISDAPEDHAVDPDRLVLVGGSAGAGLATALCIRLKEQRRRQPLLQLLVYPMLDDRELPSIRALEGGSGHWGLWHLRAERLSWAAYLGEDARWEAAPAEAVPGRASIDTLVGLAPAFIGVGDVDAFVDSNLNYAAMLLRAGVSVELHVYPGVIHGGFLPRPPTPGTQKFLRDAYSAIHRALDVPDAPVEAST